ncbi:MAG: hypothetical protein AAGH48_04020, partial [Pseudomonadota bacterium]
AAASLPTDGADAPLAVSWWLLENGEPRRLPVPPGAIPGTFVGVSTLVYADQKGRLIQRSRSGNERVVYQFDHKVREVLLSRDKLSVIVRDERQRVTVLSIQTSRPRLSCTLPDAENVMWLGTSRNGSYLVYSTLFSQVDPGWKNIPIDPLEDARLRVPRTLTEEERDRFGLPR